ncbi:TonB-dependent receptor [Bordetella sp. BOR01]|uniref:TonB-dependent receptor n=1 Tax=Bordetella sp. BOR01 TaxID=2854779 RepID=UPI001C45B5C2|nr:TonB-dependent receptor [Bordetella sp. BOR01]MBV7486392.1 TonB-dependent receptor [Bordetella sp. BOR01]
MAWPVQAQGKPAVNLSIPAQPLNQALLQLGQQADIQIYYLPEIVRGLDAPAISGVLTPEQALRTLLQGTGIQYERNGNAVTLRRTGEVAELPAVSVTGESPAGPSDLSAAYPGGQVARGARLGMLGIVDIADVPFSVTAYTSELIENQQARNLGDVISNDASVQLGGPWHFDNFYIRGLPLNREEIGFNGLYGIASTEGNVLDGIERVELLKGPNTLLTGASPRGTAGGGINLVPKRADDTPLTRLTANYMSDGNVGGHADIGRRFGADNRFGIRINAAYRDGDSSTDNESQRVGMLSAGLDYRGERLKVSADAGVSSQRIDGAKSNFYVTSPDLPSAPAGSTNVWPSWSYQEKQHTFGMVRADYDVSDYVTLGAAYGGAESTRKMNSPFGIITNGQGDISFSPSALEEDNDTESLEATARLRIPTGPITQQVVLAYTDFRSDISNYQPQTTWSATSNLYDPVSLPEPPGLDFDQALTPLSSTRLRSYAITDTLSALDDRVLLTAGLRHQRIRVNAYHWATGAFESRYEKSRNTPALGLVVKPVDGLSLYANYVEALSQGDTAPNTAVNANEVFAPFVSRQGEVGAKVDWGTLSTTLSAFQIKRPSGFLDGSNRYVIAGQQRNRGLEFQAFGEITPGIRLLSSVAWTQAILTKTAGGQFDGNEAAGVPKWSVRLGGEVDIPYVPGLTATARVIYASSQAFSADNSMRLPSWTRIDLGARYTTRVAGRQVVLRAVVENVANRRYWDTAPAYQTVTYAAPRTFLLSATVDF